MANWTLSDYKRCLREMPVNKSVVKTLRGHRVRRYARNRWTVDINPRTLPYHTGYDIATTLYEVFC